MQLVHLTCNGKKKMGFKALGFCPTCVVNELYLYSFPLPLPRKSKAGRILYTYAYGHDTFLYFMPPRPIRLPGNPPFSMLWLAGRELPLLLLLVALLYLLCATHFCKMFCNFNCKRFARPRKGRKEKKESL